MSSTSARAAASSAASIVKRMLLPTVTPLDAVEAERGQRPLDGRALRVGDALPCGWTSTSDRDTASSARCSGRRPGQSANARPVMRS